jgi:hypothetical protein
VGPVARGRGPFSSSNRVERTVLCRVSTDDETASSVKSTAVELASSIEDLDCVPSQEDQEAIAQAARLVLDRAKAVLHEKLEDYERELEALEKDASRNFVYRCGPPVPNPVPC